MRSRIDIWQQVTLALVTLLPPHGFHPYTSATALNNACSHTRSASDRASDHTSCADLAANCEENLQHNISARQHLQDDQAADQQAATERHRVAARPCTDAQPCGRRDGAP